MQPALYGCDRVQFPLTLDQDLSGKGRTDWILGSDDPDPVMILTSDKQAPNPPPRPASEGCSPIIGSMACHQCGGSVVARRVTACVCPVDRSTDHRIAGGASRAVLV